MQMVVFLRAFARLSISLSSTMGALDSKHFPSSFPLIVRYVPNQASFCLLVIDEILGSHVCMWYANCIGVMVDGEYNG